MREPFQRPLSARLMALPEGMSNIYDEELRKMGSNYVDLLRTALTWTLLGPVPLKVEEIMDIYHGTYRARGPKEMKQAITLDEPKFGTASELDKKQLTDASGPFLWLDRKRSSGSYFVNLQDPAQIRDFCLQSSDEGTTETHADGEICVRCKKAVAEHKTLSISEKEAHLDIALACLRSLNSPVFQRRAMGEKWTGPKSAEHGPDAG